MKKHSRQILQSLHLLILVSAAAIDTFALTQKEAFAIDAQPRILNLPAELKLQWVIWFSSDRLIGYSYQPSEKAQLGQLDLTTNAFKPIQDTSVGDQEALPSPDGQRVLMLQASQTNLQWIVKGLDNRVYASCKATRDQSPGGGWNPGAGWVQSHVKWTPDSRGWAQMEFEKQGAVMHLYRIGPYESVTQETFKLEGFPRLIGFTDPRHVLITNDFSEREDNLGESCDIITYELPSHHPDAVRKGVHKFAFPDSFVDSCVLAPDGKRLCWSLITAFDLPEPMPENALIRRKGAGAALWISDVNGGSKRNLVTINLPGTTFLVAPSPGISGVTNLLWSQDGRQIMYNIRGKFWQIDVPNSGQN